MLSCKVIALWIYLKSPFLSAQAAAPRHVQRLAAPRGWAKPLGAFVRGAPLCGPCCGHRFEACGEEIKLSAAGRHWVWLFTILASRWWHANRCTPMAGPSPVHLLTGRAGGCTPAPRQLQHVLLPGMAEDKVVRDGGWWPSTINLFTLCSEKGRYGKNALIWIFRDEKWMVTRRW